MAERDGKALIAYAWHHARLALVVALLTAIVVAASPINPAAAHEFDLLKSDDSIVTFASDETNDNDWSWWNHFVFYEQRDQYDARTDLAVREEPRRGYNAYTDIIWWATSQAALGAGINADYRCVKVDWSTGRCYQGHARFNETYTRRVPVNTGWYLVCHEFGHAYGLDHLDTWEAGCMTTRLDPWNPPSTGGSLNNHMIWHINGLY